MKNKYYIFIFIISIILFQRVFGNFSINEVLPNTDDDTIEEYIGISYDGEGNNSLSGYTLSDLSGKIYTFGDDFFENGEIKNYYRPTTKILLNDTNETLYLKDDSGVLVDTFSYTTTENGVVYTKYEDLIVNNPIQTEEIIEQETNTGVIIEESEILIIDGTTGTGNLIIDEEINSDEIIENTGSIIEDEITNSGSLIEENFSNSGVINLNISRDLTIKNIFQSPSYLIEKNIDLISNFVYNCDRTKDDCRVNFDFGSTFSGDIKESDFMCIINFDLGGKTGEENKCNPNTVVFPVGSHNISIKVTNKNDYNYFGELNFRIINDGKLITQTNQIVTNYVTTSEIIKPEIILEQPIIKIQSGLDNKNKCNSKECKINFIYESKNKDIICKWDFGNNIKSDGNEEKCNPNYIYFPIGKHEIYLEICDKNNDYNCKKSVFLFENIFKKTSLESIIGVQGKLSKNKIQDGNKISCINSSTCSINFTGTNSRGNDIDYFWDFGNGEYYEGKNPPSKVFSSGSYRIVLEVSDEDGDYNESNFDVEVIPEIIKINEEEVNIENKNSLGGKIQDNIELKIELQGKLGSNKIMKMDNLLCIKTCSVNFDGSSSKGDIKSYFWDFGNGETYSGKNPAYITYKKFGKYTVLFSVENNFGSVVEKEFNVNFVEKIEEKKEVITKNKSSNNLGNEEKKRLDEYIVQNEIDIQEDNEKGLSGKGISFIFTIISFLSFFLLKRYNIF